MNYKRKEKHRDMIYMLDDLYSEVMGEAYDIYKDRSYKWEGINKRLFDLYINTALGIEDIIHELEQNLKKD